MVAAGHFGQPKSTSQPAFNMTGHGQAN